MYDANAHNLPNRRVTAMSLGSKLYFTGAPCKFGHIAPRYTSTGGCTLCCANHARRQIGRPEVWPTQLTVSFKLASGALIKEVERFVDELNAAYIEGQQSADETAAANVAEFLRVQREGFKAQQEATAMDLTGIAPSGSRWAK